MQATAKRVFGEGRLCNNKGCNLRLATKEDGIEVDGKVYHERCNPLKKPRPVLSFQPLVTKFVC